MFKPEITYGYNDIGIMSAPTTEIEHRAECITKKDGMLPIFTAPMSTVLNEKNADIFEDNKIIPIIPRSVDISLRNKIVKSGRWVAYSLNEFEKFIEQNDSINSGTKILIDLANGHMKKIFDLAKKARNKYGYDDLTLMSGNIDNPEAYKEYCRAGINYVRVGVGGGKGCLSSTQLGVHIGIATLINETYKLKKEVERDIQGIFTNYKCVTKIIADGGIRDYKDVNIALALGADYVMIGSVLASLVESCATTFYYDEDNNFKIVDQLSPWIKIRENGGVFEIMKTYHGEEVGSYVVNGLKKNFYGMASSMGQKDLFGKKVRTVEGKQVVLDCTTNIDKWVENMSDYLSSAMSYCDITDVNDFNPENVETRLLSESEKAAINK